MPLVLNNNRGSVLIQRANENRGSREVVAASAEKEIALFWASGERGFA